MARTDFAGTYKTTECSTAAKISCEQLQSRWSALSNYSHLDIYGSIVDPFEKRTTNSGFWRNSQKGIGTMVGMVRFMRTDIKLPHRGIGAQQPANEATFVLISGALLLRSNSVNHKLTLAWHGLHHCVYCVSESDTNKRNSCEHWFYPLLPNRHTSSN